MSFDRFQPPKVEIKCRWCGRMNQRRNLPCWKCGRTLPASDGSGQRCVRFQCDEADLVWLEVGQSRQTYNGFLVAKVPGWYCPKCAGAYGP